MSSFVILIFERLLRFKLLSKECQNQGYVLDGYPKTIEQAIMLFTSESVGDEEDERDMTEAKDEELMAILPDFVIAFDASDEFLMSRIADLAERDVHHSRYSESNMITRLARYRCFFIFIRKFHSKDLDKI